VLEQLLNMQDKKNSSTAESVFGSLESQKEYWEINKEFIDGSKLFGSHLAAIREAERIVSIAKIFIIENWMKVTDWNILDLNLYSTFDNTYHQFHNHVSNERNESDLPECQNKPYEFWQEYSKKRHNPILVFDHVFLDYDGDFNVTINGKTIGWLDNDSIIELANKIQILINKK
jgi:hypothetical protein